MGHLPRRSYPIHVPPCASQCSSLVDGANLVPQSPRRGVRGTISYVLTFNLQGPITPGADEAKDSVTASNWSCSRYISSQGVQSAHAEVAPSKQQASRPSTRVMLPEQAAIYTSPTSCQTHIHRGRSGKGTAWDTSTAGDNARASNHAASIPWRSPSSPLRPPSGQAAFYRSDEP